MQSVSWLILLLIGFLTGSSSALFGIGGSAILIPALLIIGKYEQKQATITTLAVSLPAVFVGFLTYAASAQISTEFAYLVRFGSILISAAAVGTFLGSHLLNKLRSPVITMIFSLVLIMVGLKMMQALDIPIHAYTGNALYAVLVIAGFLAGTGNALLGIGGGAILIPGLYLFAGFPQHHAVILSLAVIGPTTLISLFQHRKSNLVCRTHVRTLLPAALLGAIIGALIGNSLSAPLLSIGFGIFITVFAIYMLAYTLYTEILANIKKGECGCNSPKQNRAVA